MLKTKTKTASFKVMLPETGSELCMAIWASGTPEHFLIHMHRVVYFINQMSLAMKFKEQVDIIEP